MIKKLLIKLLTSRLARSYNTKLRGFIRLLVII